MPELPDIEAYLAALRPRIVGRELAALRLASPFLLRSVDPPPARAVGREVVELRRLGKRIVIGLDGSLFLVLHLMIAGRLRWKAPSSKVPGKIGLAVFDFESGSLVVTEAGTRKRASLHVVDGEDELATHDPGGLEVLERPFEQFRRVLRSRRHTLKRSLTDPRLFSGIGNAYSDEILHRAGLSPFKLTTALDEKEIERLHEATRAVLAHWTQRLLQEVGEGFPERVTAFREGMAVHGRYRQPCPRCGTSIQRIVYAANEANYCPRCQTGGKLLADRALSRLLREDWPRTVDELERWGSTKPSAGPPGRIDVSQPRGPGENDEDGNLSRHPEDDRDRDARRRRPRPSRGRRRGR